MQVQIITPDQVRAVAGRSGIEGRAGVIYQTLKNGSTPSRSYVWDGEKHVQFGQPEVQALVSEAGIGPLKITAPTGYVLGATLTATTNAGWVVGGYQWTRDGADIAGATSSTYTLTLADVQMPHLPPSVIGCRAVSPVYTYLALVPVGTFPDGYLSLNNGALSLNDGLLSLV